MSKQAELVLNFKRSRGTINPMIYGHFTEHIGGVFYDGLWVGEDSPIENIRGFRKKLVDSFRKINPGVVRWPGGCFAEIYDWRDGIGPRDQRPERVNWWYSYDGRTESNAVGTHEFIDFCRMVGAEPYIAANMSSTTPLHIRNWMEYCNHPAGRSTFARERGENGSVEPFNVKYWGIGNETWGGGGQLNPEWNAREYIRYTTICNSINKRSMNFIFPGATMHDIEWTRRCMREWADRPHEEAPTWGMSIHYYGGFNKDIGWPQTFTEEQWYRLMFYSAYMKNIVDDHRAAMDEFDPERKIKLVIDEWGAWYHGGSGPSKGYNLFEQQSNLRDAVVAALTLNVFNNRCDVVAMSNIAQLCNNIHALFLAGGENFVETPTYHVYDMFKTHQNGRQIDTSVHGDTLEFEGFAPIESLSASASEKDGKLTLTLANLHMTEAQEVKLTCVGFALGTQAEMTVLAHEEVHTCNTFEDPTAVTPTSSTVTLGDTITVPAGGVVSVIVDLA